jgi:hypothetical protein
MPTHSSFQSARNDRFDGFVIDGVAGNETAIDVIFQGGHLSLDLFG